MKKLIVLAFDNEDGALEVRDKLFELQTLELITMEDAAVVVRNEQGKTDVKQAQSSAARVPSVGRSGECLSA